VGVFFLNTVYIEHARLYILCYKLISYHSTTWSWCCLSTVDDRSIALVTKDHSDGTSPKYRPFLYKQEAKLSLG